MSEPILIKGNKYGLSIVMDSDATFDIIKEALIQKLEESRKFFGNVKVIITIEGRETSKEENDEILAIIQEYSDIAVISIIDSNFKEAAIKQQNDENIEDEPEVDVLEKEEPKQEDLSCFHRGTLRSGQEVVSDSSIVVIGNVNDGAKVVSEGNIVVIGKLAGYVTAGKSGNNEAFVVALSMNPSQIRIGDVVARSGETNNKRLTANQDNPQIAYVEGDRIVIEDISQSKYDSFSFK